MKNSKKQQTRGQSAVEYLILLGVCLWIVLVGFRVYLPQSYMTANAYFNEMFSDIVGDPPSCGDGVCNCTTERSEARCPTDCDFGSCP